MYQEIKNKFSYNVNEFEGEKRFDIKSFFGPKSIIIYILSILIGACKLSSGATPFGLALLGAIADCGFPLIVPLILIAVTMSIAFGRDMPFKVYNFFFNIYNNEVIY